MIGGLVLKGIVLYMVCFHCGSLAQSSCPEYETASKNLREIVIGTCTLYQQNVNQPVFCPNGFRNCTEIWEAFYTAFLYQPKCNVSIERFTRYVQLTHHEIPSDKSIFWENVYPFVMRFSQNGIRYTSISDTLPGYIGDGLQWCSKEEAPGIEPPGTVCPGYEKTPDCYQSALRAFWLALSKNFGASATGNVHIMLNATHTPIFSPDTVFALYELTSLRPDFVTKATVLLLNDSPETGKDACSDNTLDLLKAKLESKGIRYECVENRRDVVMTYCLDYPAASMCDSVVTPISADGNTLNNSVITTLLLSLICFTIFK